MQPSKIEILKTLTKLADYLDQSGQSDAADLADKAIQEVTALPAVGQHGPITFPSNHQPGMKVPKGGSCCANCTFFKMKEGKPHCGESHFIKWNGNDLIPTDDPASYCSDWYSPQ